MSVSQARTWLNSTSDQIQDGGLHPNLKSLNRNNSDDYGPVLLKYGIGWCVYGPCDYSRERP